MHHRFIVAENSAAHANERLRSRLDSQIDPHHRLAPLAQRTSWAELEDTLSMTAHGATVGARGERSLSIDASGPAK